jgi:hypothetical protein
MRGQREDNAWFGTHLQLQGGPNGVQPTAPAASIRRQG